MPRLKQFDEQEVLEKAMEIFWKFGYHGTSIQNLVDGLGINRASLYDTFGDKHGLFVKALQNYQLSNKDELVESFKALPQIRQGIYNMFLVAVEESLEDQDKKGCLMVNTATELGPHDAKVCKILLENQENFIAFFSEILEEAQLRGEIAPEKDIHALAAYLFTLYNGIKVIAKIDPSRPKLHSVVKTGMEVIYS